MPPKRARRAARAHFVYVLVSSSPMRVTVTYARTTTPRTWHPPSDVSGAAGSPSRKREREEDENA